MSRDVTRSRGPGVLDAWGVGLAMLTRYTGLAAFLYGIQLAVSAGAAVVMARILGTLYAHRPLFDAAVEGDLAALAEALRAHPWLVAALASIGLAAAGLYLVLSWFLLGGLVNVFLERPAGRSEVAERFGRGGALAFLPYLRLALWSVLPWGVVLAALVLGLAVAGPDLERALSPWQLLAPIAAGVAPAALLAILVQTAIDYARVDLSRHIGLSSWRALLRGFRFVFTSSRALLHALVFYGLFAAATFAYLALTAGRPVLGTAAVLSLFALRQGLAVLRFAARFALVGGQVELCQMALPPVTRYLRKR